MLRPGLAVAIKFPVTLIWVTATLVVAGLVALDGGDAADAPRAWGQVVQRRVVSQPELYGPFDIWNGDDWRVWSATLHYRTLPDLVISLAIGCWLGTKLEPRLGSLPWCLLIIAASLAGNAAEYAAGRVNSGATGLLIAGLVLLCGLPPVDGGPRPRWQRIMTVVLAIVIAVCVVTDHRGWDRVASWAVIVGGLVGCYCLLIHAVAKRMPTPGKSRVTALGFGLILMGLISSLGFRATRPTHLGRYHWYQALRTHDPAVRVRELEAAVDRSPELVGAWLQLLDAYADQTLRRPDDLELQRRTFRLALRSVANNRDDRELFDWTRSRFRWLVAEKQRTLAEECIRTVFGREADAWLMVFQQAPAATIEPSRSGVEPRFRPEDFPLNQPVDIRPPRAPAGGPPMLPLPPADAGDSAAAGQGV